MLKASDIETVLKSEVMSENVYVVKFHASGNMNSSSICGVE
jgi:hypothetical protein